MTVAVAAVGVCAQRGGGGGKSVNAVCGGGSVKSDTQCAVTAAAVRV